MITKLAKDFWSSFHSRFVSALILLQVAFLLLTIGILFSFKLLSDQPLASAAIIGGQVVVAFVISLVIYHIVTVTFKDLVAAIVHISGEPTTTTPPNPNEKRYEKNGLKDILQTLYQLARERDQKEEAVEAATPVATGPAATVIQPAAPTTATKPAAELALQAALDETICGFVVFDHDRRIIFSNKAAPTSVNQDNVSSLSLIFPEDDTLTKWLDECEASAVHAEKNWTRISDKLPDEEGRRFFDVFASYDKGAASETIITLIDRTNLYSIGEQELDFIAFAAHELRGPITVIRGYLDVLEDELDDVLKDDQHELFRRLTVSANRLSGYINNILNTSRYDRRHLRVHLAESSLADIYATIKDDMDLRASSQGRFLSVTIPEDLPTIPADPASLSEVVGNLIDNAIKYSNEGGSIEVSAAKKDETVEITVTDHGIGMPGSVISNLFQKFYRSHRSRETVSGTGIGLYISKGIVESHGGNISVRSEEGKGSTFIVSLPTYASVADKLKTGDNSNETMIANNDGWIKNHSMYRG